MASREKNKKGRFDSDGNHQAVKKRKLFGSIICPDNDSSVSDNLTSEVDNNQSTCDQDDKTLNWSDGRRIVELGHLAKQMRCSDSNDLLDLQVILI